MDVPSSTPPLKIESSINFGNPVCFNKDTGSLISRYLTDRDLGNVCCVSKNLHNIFSPSLEKRLMSIFLKYVVEGRLDKVEEILNKNPKLVFLQGDITDLSGRVFTRITAFQYATWALDKEMWELILKYLREIDAYNQLMALEQKRPDITQVHGTRLNFAPLLNAYQKYMNNYDAWYVAKKWGQLEACWCKKVGGAQRQMPAWFVYVFCEEGEEGAWTTEDFKKGFTRDLKHLSWWFEGEGYGGKLGVNWASYRGDSGEVFFCGALGAHEGLVEAVEVERLTTSQFMEGRTNELSRLVEALSQTCGGEKKSAPNLNSTTPLNN